MGLDTVCDALENTRGREFADWPRSAGGRGPLPAEDWGGDRNKRLKAPPAEIPHTPVTSLAVLATTSHFLSYSPRRDASRRPQKHRSRCSGCRYTKSALFPLQTTGSGRSQTCSTLQAAARATPAATRSYATAKAGTCCWCFGYGFQSGPDRVLPTVVVLLPHRPANSDE